MATSENTESAECWCCGLSCPAEVVVRLDRHPEVAVCLRCAHYLGRRASAREDQLRPTAASRGHNALRAGRNAVVRRGWHGSPIIGSGLRRLGRYRIRDDVRIALESAVWGAEVRQRGRARLDLRPRRVHGEDRDAACRVATVKLDPRVGVGVAAPVIERARKLSHRRVVPNQHEGLHLGRGVVDD